MTLDPLVRGARYLLRGEPVLFTGLGDGFAQRPTFTPVAGGEPVELSGLQAFALMATGQLVEAPPWSDPARHVDLGVAAQVEAILTPEAPTRAGPAPGNG